MDAQVGLKTIALTLILKLFFLFLLLLLSRRDQFHEIGTRGGSVTKYKIGIPDIL